MVEFGWEGYNVLLLPRFTQVKLQLTDGVTGNTSDFGSEESRFEPWSVNRVNEAPKGASTIYS